MSNGPLSGIRVLDLTSYLAGPYGCTLLGDLGADIVKIEPPDGDMLRHYPSTLDGDSRAFIGANRGKRAIVIDLKTDEGRKVLYRLVDGADVFVQNFRPAVPTRLGIDYATLRARNPRLVYCAVTGYGESGVLRDQPGYDQVLQSMSGIASFQGASTCSPPQLVVGSIVDYYTSSLTALGIVAALFHRERTGQGQAVGASLLASALAMQSGRFVWADNEGRDVSRELTPGRTAGIHPTAKGYLYISAHTERFWTALCEIVGLPELARHPRYDTMRKRAEHADELVPKLHGALARRSAAQWETLMKGKVPSAVVRPIEDMFEHPQVVSEGLVRHFRHAGVGGYRGLAAPVHFSACPTPQSIGAPLLGEHTKTVLSELGFTGQEIAHLRSIGAVR